MVSFRSLYFVHASSKNRKFVRGLDGNFKLEKIDRNLEEEDAIMRVILHSKIHQTIGFNMITYEYLVSLFKPQYKWLTSSKLRKFVSKSRNLLEVNTQSPKLGNAKLLLLTQHWSNKHQINLLKLGIILW